MRILISSRVSLSLSIYMYTPTYLHIEVYTWMCALGQCSWLTMPSYSSRCTRRFKFWRISLRPSCVCRVLCLYTPAYTYIYIYTHTYILAYISLCLCIVGDSGLDLQCLVYFWMREAFVNLKHFSLGIFMHLCHVCEDTTVGVNKKEWAVSI